MSKASSDSTPAEQETSVQSLEQRESLLRTKLFIPPNRSSQVPRSHLLEQLNRGLDKALTLVSAPAGYGKTSLVSSWLRGLPTASVWLSLDEGDNDPARFLQYFVTAIQQIVSTPGQDLLGLLQTAGSASPGSSLNILINVIAEHAAPFVLVLDDFHLIDTQPILEMLTFLLEHIPPQMHLVLLSRTDPPLPLARWRARFQLVDIRADQLRFTPAEIAIFLNEVMGLKLSAEEVAALEARTEGWIAGLQLAALSMQGCKDIHSFVSAFSGSHYYVMDYLAEEVLQHQPENVRAFLLQTSILGRMCGPLCNAVVEADVLKPADGQILLETLEQRNVFVIPLDNERHWFRYHHLFVEVLNRRLEHHWPQLLPELHRRASHWYEQNGLISEAIHHARLAGDPERAAQLVDQHGRLLLMRGEVVNLLSWIEAVEPHSQTLPWIAIQKVWALCLTGQRDRLDGSFQTAERLVSSLELTDEARTMSGAITAARASWANRQGETRLAAGFARQALEGLPDSNDFYSCSLRSAATAILGDASWMEGNLAEAERAYTQALLISQAAGYSHMGIITTSNLANVLMEQGQLHLAARRYSETVQMAALPDGGISPLAEEACAGLGQVSYEWNHLEAAAEYIHRCLECTRRWGTMDFQSIGYVLLARLEHVQGQPEKAREAMRTAEQLLSEYPHSLWRTIWLKSALARLWIAQEDFAGASLLIQKCGLSLDGLPQASEISYPQEPAYLAWLHLRLAQGDYEAVLALAVRWLQKIDAPRRVGRAIEILVLQALAHQGKKDMDQALAVLGKAFALARPEGYVRTFLDEGEPMAKLLYQAKTHGMETGYASELLAALGQASDSVLPPAQLLIEPLTPRELELLKLIEAGYTNQEIAAKLVISMPTVKRHISNIYTKLGANSRTQAVARGKELNLFN
jgi:LuxR family transcriptional regulator, maltose regulon positive regulatory protein